MYIYIYIFFFKLSQHYFFHGEFYQKTNQKKSNANDTFCKIYIVSTTFIFLKHPYLGSFFSYNTLVFSTM